MTALTKELIESIETIGVLPRRLHNAVLSEDCSFKIFYGTYQQVVNALDAEGIPEHKVKGFQIVSSGNCIAIVHKH